MTSIEEVLSKCTTRVEFDRKYINKMPVKCYTCRGFREDAERRNCEDYKPFLKRRYTTHENR